MAEKIIKMKLNYKGKLLDITKKGEGKGDIKKKWFIGSNKHIFWQILDPKFPDKHLFLEEKSGEYFINITTGSELSCEKNGKPIDKEFLKSNKLLSGSQLKITRDMSGTVALSKDWAIQFEFVEPWKRVLSAEERQIVAQYSRRAELTPLEKRNKTFLIGVTLFTVLFLFVYDNFLKKEVVIEETIESKFENIVAQRVEAAKLQPRVNKQTYADSGPAEVVETPAETGAATTTTTQRSNFGSQLAASVGGGAPGASGADGGASLKAVTTSRTIVARGVGDGGGGGRGPGPGGAAGAGRGGASLASSADPSARRAGREYIGDIATGSIGGGVEVSNLQSGQAISKFSGDASTIKPGKPVVSASAQATISRVTGSGAKIVEEGKIPEGDAVSKTTYEAAIANLRPIRQRLQSTFNRYSSIGAMYGSIKFTIYVESNGNVDVVVEVQSGEFQQEFIDAAIDVIKKSRFTTNMAMVIPFTQQFRRN
jgi:hypothetical protein